MQLRYSPNVSEKTVQVIQHFQQEPFAKVGYHENLLTRGICGQWKGTYHSLISGYFRNRYALSIPFERELITLEDGGMVALDWANQKPVDKCKLVLICPALLDSSRAQSVQRLIQCLESKGEFRCVVYIPRGCGGLELKTPRLTNVYVYKEFIHVMQKLKQEPCVESLFAVGFSMGAGTIVHALAKWNEMHPDEDPVFTGIVTISPSWDYHKNQGPVYDWWSEKILAPAIKKHCKRHEANLALTDEERMVIKEAKYAIDIDEGFIAKRLGKKDVVELYDQSSPIHYVSQLDTPTLCISSLDDPIANGATIPAHADIVYGSSVVSYVTNGGGHSGFMPTFSFVESWADQVTYEWLKSCAKIH